MVTVVLNTLSLSLAYHSFLIFRKLLISEEETDAETDNVNNKPHPELCKSLVVSSVVPYIYVLCQNSKKNHLIR